MTREEFKSTASLMQANWKMFDTQDKFDLWFSFFKHYDHDIFDEAVRNTIKRMQSAPTVNAVLEDVKAVRAKRERNENPVDFDSKKGLIILEDGRKIRTYRCEKCLDVGALIFQNAEGYDVMRPCTCQLGQSKFAGVVTMQEEGRVKR